MIRQKAQESSNLNFYEKSQIRHFGHFLVILHYHLILINFTLSPRGSGHFIYHYILCYRVMNRTFLRLQWHRIKNWKLERSFESGSWPSNVIMNYVRIHFSRETHLVAVLAFSSSRFFYACVGKRSASNMDAPSVYGRLSAVSFHEW